MSSQTLIFAKSALIFLGHEISGPLFILDGSKYCSKAFLTGISLSSLITSLRKANRLLMVLIKGLNFVAYVFARDCAKPVDIKGNYK